MPQVEQQPDIRIVPFEPNDAFELAHFAVRAYSAIYGYGKTEEDIRREVIEEGLEKQFQRDAETDDILLAKEGATIVGYTQFGDPSPEEEQPVPADSKEFRKLYVANEMHGRGVGPRLMQAALDHPTLANASQVYLWVWGENSHAINFYKKREFKEKVARHYKDSSGNATYDWMMVRRQED